MRKACNAALEARTADCFEVSKRLNKNVAEIVKRLDEQKNHALTITDIFIPSEEVLRAKLKDYCERLILKDPIGNARKTEELLWRKAFYDLFHRAKKLRKGKTWSDAEKALLSIHLTTGVGYYHHLILKLQLEYNLDLSGVIDFAFIYNESISSLAKTKVRKPKNHTNEIKQCVMRLIHRNLICLGDLNRYKLELDPNWDPMIANRYYKMAIAIEPNIGMPHNQLGTIAGNINFGLDAVYHYMRCILCPEPFEGSEGNLKRSIITHSICTDENNSVQHCVSQLFSLLRSWDYENPNSAKINQECQNLLTDIENCLIMEQSESDNADSLVNADNIETYLQNCKIKPIHNLTDDMIFKIVAICLMSISRLKSKESSEVQGAIAVTLAILSQLLQHTITRLQDSTMTMSDIQEMDIYSSKLKNAVENQMLLEQENNENHTKEEEIILGKDHSIDSISNIGKDDKSCVIEKENKSNNEIVNKNVKKTFIKKKNPLSKFRRRKRNSSDSDTSDMDRQAGASSSDEINSDMSETEDDVLSEENGLSEDALSDENTDDEESQNKVQIIEGEKEQINGHSNKSDEIENFNKNDINDIVNNKSYTIDEQINLKHNDKDSIINSGGVLTITDSISIFEESTSSTNTIAYIKQEKKQNLNSDDILNVLIDKQILASIKICCDWLQSNPDIVRICAKSSRTLLKRLMILLNLINVDTEVFIQSGCEENSLILSNAEKLKEYVKTVPLPEDIDLRGLNLLEGTHKSLDWMILYKRGMCKREETLLRALKLIEFGYHLSSIENSGVKYDHSKRLFVIIDSSPSNTMKTGGLNENFGPEHPRGKLMRHMGKLWLKAEVRALESSLRSRLISPYLVPDHEALSKHMPTLKRLVYTKKFIIVIPTVVISALDEVKRISSQAREATRWLETQLRRGSRFLRAQRPHERLALPLIKGPKPKDKEAWLFFQIIECCHYLTQQSKAGFAGDGEAPVVTLLTGCNPDDRKALTFSPDGLAKSAGVNLEHIESFQSKWKSSSKSHG